MCEDSISKLKEIIKGDFPAARVLRDSRNLEIKEYISYGLPVSRLAVKSELAAVLLEKAPGTYVTVMTGPLEQTEAVDDSSACVAELLRELLAPYFGGKMLICGIGNQEQAPDSLGPETVRRLPLKALEEMGSRSEFARISAVSPGVEWFTNLNTAEWIAGIAASVGATCVLLIDSMMCECYHRLCTNIQLSDTGMSRHCAGQRLDRNTIGVPVIAIGVPTTVRASAILREHTGDTLLTVSHISSVIKTAAHIIAAAILQAVCPELDEQEVNAFVEHNLIW